ncbi:YhbY family RNA-binding protein [Bordetella pertussis]|uniref:YhbY family RNA-binding protein n=1 Tax=Bordetella pertussis TaxID=520 RepID=UPI0005EA3C6C|nr:YhbY family RNA-binding protein [Bordetella pertussis]CPP40745.1 RNA-binding protein YhbY [Bordetella pertussis]
MPILELTSRERSDLRSAAHPLRPVVLIGDNGLTDAVLKEIDLALTAHELIKVRAGGDDREAREAMLATICDTLSCAAVHHLGKSRPARPSTRKASPGHAIPRRSGSALSLRAGARGGLAGRKPARANKR